MAHSIVVAGCELQEETGRRTFFPPRQLLFILLVCVGYYVGALLGKTLKFPSSNLSFLWPPTAVLMAALLLAPARQWWLYVLAVAPVHILVQALDNVPVLGILSQFVGNFGQALLGATTMRSIEPGGARFDNLRGVLIFSLGAAFFAPVVVSSLVAYLYVLSGWEHDFWYVWRARILSNVLSTLTIVPLILTAAAVITQARKFRPWVLVEGGVIAVGVALIGVVALRPTTEAAILLYAPLPFLLWAAIRLGIGGLCFSILVTAYMVFLDASVGQGPFATKSPAANVLSLQLFLITISLPLIVLAALTEERRTKEKALRESEARYRALVTASADIVWRANESGEGFFVTPGWQNLTGQNAKETPGYGWLDAVHPNDRERSRRLWEQAVKSKHAYEDEFRILTHDGSYRHFHVHAVPILAPDGSVHEWVGANTDISERKRAQAEVHRQREELAHVGRLSTMGELAASLTHELNQPLTAILSNAQAAQRFLASKLVDLDEVREILKDIVEDNGRASEVIRRMRALVKKEKLELAPVDLGNLIRDVVTLVHSDAIFHNTRVLLELSPDLPPVLGDKIGLQQLALNLLLNAFDAMSDTPVNERQIIVRVEVDGAEMVRVGVRDRGTGLSGEQLEKIFEPFYTTKRDGLGMGLSISRSIVEAHGGRLWAENNKGRGATFYFTARREKKDEFQGAVRRANKLRTKDLSGTSPS